MGGGWEWGGGGRWTVNEGGEGLRAGGDAVDGEEQPAEHGREQGGHQPCPASAAASGGAGTDRPGRAARLPAGIGSGRGALTSDEEAEELDWPQRLEVALQAAWGRGGRDDYSGASA